MNKMLLIVNIETLEIDEIEDKNILEHGHGVFNLKKLKFIITSGMEIMQLIYQQQKNKRNKFKR